MGHDGPGRYEGANWRTLATGAPILADALVAFDCEIDQTIAKHSHEIVIGRIRATLAPQGDSPLIYWSRCYEDIFRPRFPCRPRNWRRPANSDRRRFGKKGPRKQHEFSQRQRRGGEPEILAALVAANDGFASPYGQDRETALAQDLLRDVFKCELQAFLVASGTAANALALGAVSPPWGAIFCHDRAHVMQDECGAPELFTGGAKLVGVHGDRGKIALAALDERLAASRARAAGRSRPAALSLAQANECGAVVFGRGDFRARVAGA